RDAVRLALVESPELTVVRQRREIAQAGIVLARLYPHNPMLSLTPRACAGPQTAGIIEPFTIETSLTLEIDRKEQRRLRRQVAQCALSRTEWEVAAEELAVVGKALRAFNTTLYREQKLRLLGEQVQLAQRSLADVEKLHEKRKEKLPAGERVLLQFEIQEAKAQEVAGRGPLVAAEQEFRQVFGRVRTPAIQGVLQLTDEDHAVADLETQALTARPDLRARQAAHAEALAALGLEQASRFGNPVFGPSYGTQEAAAHYIGVTITFGLPMCNRKQGEIRLREAELHRAALEIGQLEIQIRQEVSAALARINQVQDVVRLYRDEYLPALRARLQELQRLYLEDDPAVDVQQVLELFRRLLKARESYLDALYEHAQLKVDLALAAGDVELAFNP
ncbi:MAG: TolC family protein, partial [Planctomycetia bacterium]|nr:TolC family protein [Planctomycetia bacterium]